MVSYGTIISSCNFITLSIDIEALYLPSVNILVEPIPFCCWENFSKGTSPYNRGLRSSINHRVMSTYVSTIFAP
uniref:Uncharacterized protein n=1 Tax=Megaselia scalaris TaxID=36166 RepID=T1GDU6_MEGSC